MLFQIFKNGDIKRLQAFDEKKAKGYAKLLENDAIAKAYYMLMFSVWHFIDGHRDREFYSVEETIRIKENEIFVSVIIWERKGEIKVPLPCQLSYGNGSFSFGNDHPLVPSIERMIDIFYQEQKIENR